MMEADENSYYAAAKLYREGRIDYEGLKALVSQLPTPDAQPVSNSVAEIYVNADRAEGDNSLMWLEVLYDCDVIDLDQLMELIDVACDNKDSTPPS